MRKPGGSSGDESAALFLSPEAPYPMAGGGPMRSAAMLHYLARRYPVDAVFFRGPEAPDPVQALPADLVRQAHVLHLPFHSPKLAARASRNVMRLLRGVPPLNDRFAGFSEAILDFLRGRRYRLGVIEHFWCAGYCELLAAHADSVVLDLHNVESALAGGCAEAEPWPISAAHRRFRESCMALEKQLLPRFHFVLTASDQDAARVHELAPQARVDVYPNTIPLVAAPPQAEEDRIVFSGNLAYHPNKAAVRFFRREVWPLLRERWPALCWTLIGKNPHAVAKYVDDPRIRLVGPVENAVAHLAGAKAAVAPLLAGGGTRIKILEAWAAGVPVVSTGVGAEGLGARHREHLLIADGPQQFADAVSSLLASSELRRSLAASGRALYEDQFTWEAGWAQLQRIGI